MPQQIPWVGRGSFQSFPWSSCPLEYNSSVRSVNTASSALDPVEMVANMCTNFAMCQYVGATPNGGLFVRILFYMDTMGP